MISGSKRKNKLRAETIYKYITPYDIYKEFCGVPFELGKAFSSPLREDDDTPSFLIKNWGGELRHCDYGDGEFRGRAIDFVMQKEHCNYDTALRLIDTRFGLGIRAPLKDWKAKVEAYTQPEIEDEEGRGVFINISTKKFTPGMHGYWNAYHLSEEYLKNKDVFQVKSLYLGSKRYRLPKDEIVIGYWADDIQKYKIYRPMTSRKIKKEDREKTWRWRSNIPFDYIFGKSSIKDCDKSLVLKSRKDELVLSLITPCVASVQAENIGCFSTENVEFLNKNSREVYICFGSDSQAKRESNLITRTFNWKHINTPDKYLPLNDFAEVAKVHGLEVLEKHLKQKKII